jgi:hypothetical protein
MSKLLIVTVKQDAEAGPNRNGDVFIPGRLTVTDVRKAGFVDYVRHYVRRWKKPSADDMKRLPDTGLSVGIPITTDQYSKLMGLTGASLSIGAHLEMASLDLIQAPKPTQMVGSPVEI